MRVVISIIQNGPRFLIARRRKSEGLLKWHFPSGKKRSDESERETAEREALEETGVVCRAVKTFGDRVHPQTKAMVSYWLCEYLSGIPKPNSAEVRDLRWVSGREAINAFTSDVYEPLAEYLALTSD